MKTGRKSLLFGVHQVIWHPITVLMAWHSLYGEWPKPEELFCILIHDWGYWSCEHMDDTKGQNHPRWAAELVMNLFARLDLYNLCLYHSRHLAHIFNKEPSKLCWADKLSICYDPDWFYLLRARLSGELAEYRAESEETGFFPSSLSDRDWLIAIKKFMSDQAREQKSSFLYMHTS